MKRNQINIRLTDEQLKALHFRIGEKMRQEMFDISVSDYIRALIAKDIEQGKKA
jgi:hypothetical protein